jgi:hypothetical protein
VNIERLILRLVNGGGQDLELFAAALLPRELPAYGPAGWLEDRAHLIYATFVRLGRASRRPFSPARPSVVYDVFARKEEVRELRAYYIRRYFGEEVDFVLSDLFSGLAAPCQQTASERSRARRWRLWARVAAVASLLDLSKRRYAWWGGVFTTAHALAQASDRITRVYVFRPYDRRTYVLVTFLARHTAIVPYYVFQGMPLYFNQRNLHVPIPVVLTSKVNLPEVDFFRRAGHFKASEVLYFPQEYLLERERLQPSAPVYDIGFFATGDWARIAGRYIATDVALVRSGAYRGNVYEQHAERVLSALVAYASSRRRTLRIYMHPYERSLFREHGIEPPYRGLEDGELVTIDDAAGTSRDAVYECDVAVALRSSTIWERIDLGLDRSLMYVFGGGLDNFLPESMGPYRGNLFASVEELEARLDGLFEACDTR